MKKYLLLLLLTVSCSQEPVEPIDEFAECRTEVGVPEAVILQNLDSLGLFEGDIIPNLEKGTALTGNIWKDAVIPFYIRDKFPPATMAAIRAGVKMVNDNTYLKIVEYPSKQAMVDELGLDADFVYVILNPFANSSYVGRKGRGQYITLSFIDEPFISAHEFLHAAGMLHEMSRADRDQWIEIDWDNMDEYYHRQYTTYDERGLPETGYPGTEYGSRYDTLSLLGYPSFKNAKDATKPVMYWKADKSTWRQATKLSEGDIEAVNELYKCEYFNREIK